MKKNYTCIILCFCCIFLASCAAKDTRSMEQVHLDNPLVIPLTQESPRFFILSTNETQAHIDLVGTLTAFLQSDHGIVLANSTEDADYVIKLRIDTFHMLGTVSAPIDTAAVALPALAGTVSGAQLGAAINGADGALYGAGVGLALGLGLGTLSQEGEMTLWQMLTLVEIQHGKESFITRIDARAQGEKMDAAEAALALEAKVATAISQAFAKE